jgi:hypothetical protein
MLLVSPNDAHISNIRCILMAGADNGNNHQHTLYSQNKMNQHGILGCSILIAAINRSHILNRIGDMILPCRTPGFRSNLMPKTPFHLTTPDNFPYQLSKTLIKHGGILRYTPFF